MHSPLRKIKTHRVIYPILIGLGFVGYMFWKEFDPKAMDYVHWGLRAVLWLFVALILMAGRDLGYVWRLLILSERRISFLEALKVIFLWEFTSAITPSAIGGTSVAILYVNKAGLSVGRSSAVVMATSFLDELYFLLMFPLLLLLVGQSSIFDIVGADAAVRDGLFWIAWGGYAIKAAYVMVLSYGFFVNPRGLERLVFWVFHLPILRRWKRGSVRAGVEIVESSKEFRAKPFRYWLKAFGATFLSWTSRYWVANAIMLAFFTVGDQFVIFARQLVMWIMMLVTPTPGGSGFAEYIFTKYLGEFIPVDALALPAVITVLALLWRLATYYPYLIIGVFLFPKWVKGKFMGRKK